MHSKRRKTTGHTHRRRAALIGCGVDVVELPRFRQALARGGRAFLRRVFTSQEEAYARARKRTTLLHLAGRFAAKEAVIKALSQVEPGRFLAMNQVEVVNDRLGRPRIVLHDRGGTPRTQSLGAGSPRKSRSRRRRDDGRRSRVSIHISLSHVDTVAVASAIVVRG